ncbi:MAG: DUF2721 domain-containing protein [Beijerinckiaceae bacterium]|nr:DUF2721 domain-containing protein [Beijerinckiaceae bacterium]
MIELPDTALQSVIHVIQTSLTPIFLLSAIAALLGVFTTRLSRISDQAASLTTATGQEKNGDGGGDPIAMIRLQHLRRRSHALDIAVFLAAVGGACTCATVLALFVGALNSSGLGPVLFVLFGLAIVCTIGALSAFLTEMLIAGRGLRAEVTHHEKRLG